MNIGAELGQYILQTHSSKKFLTFSWEVEPPNHPLWVRQWPQGWNKCAIKDAKRLSCAKYDSGKLLTCISFCQAVWFLSSGVWMVNGYALNKER